LRFDPRGLAMRRPSRRRSGDFSADAWAVVCRRGQLRIGVLDLSPDDGRAVSAVPVAHELRNRCDTTEIGQSRATGLRLSLVALTGTVHANRLRWLGAADIEDLMAWLFNAFVPAIETSWRVPENRG